MDTVGEGKKSRVRQSGKASTHVDVGEQEARGSEVALSHDRAWGCG